MTLKERYVAGLKALGAVIIDGRSHKYVTMLHESDGENALPALTFFVGKRGACRVSTRGTLAHSRPVSERMRELILSKAGRETRIKVSATVRHAKRKAKKARS